MFQTLRMVRASATVAPGGRSGSAHQLKVILVRALFPNELA